MRVFEGFGNHDTSEWNGLDLTKTNSYYHTFGVFGSVDEPSIFPSNLNKI